MAISKRGVILPFVNFLGVEILTNFWFLWHKFWSRHARKPIKGSKVSWDILVSPLCHMYLHSCVSFCISVFCFGSNDSRDPSRYPMIIVSGSRYLIFNSRDPNRVPKALLKKLSYPEILVFALTRLTIVSGPSMHCSLLRSNLFVSIFYTLCIFI